MYPWNKSEWKDILDIEWRSIPGWLNQRELVFVVATVLEVLSGKIWSHSFKKVNLQPDYCLYFSRWIKNISTHINTGDTAYFRKNGCVYFDDMPEVWKNMKVEDIHRVSKLIYLFVSSEYGGKSVWKKSNVLHIVQYCMFLMRQVWYIGRLQFCDTGHILVSGLNPGSKLLQP